ncbi:MAG: hypothetical protein ACE5JH_02175 [Acidobacteriota bacterium]
MTGDATRTRRLQQELFLQELVTAVYRVYAERIDDAGGRGILEDYLRRESQRRRQLQGIGPRPPGAAARVGALFAAAGRLYGRVSALLGTRVMLRIVLSSSRRAARRACAEADRARRSARPDRRQLALMRARAEGDLCDALERHLIDTTRRGG